MTAANIIKKFELFMDDTTELSSDEALDLVNKVYQFVCMQNEWAFLHKEFSGTQSTSVDYIALPSDFAYVASNRNYSDITAYEASNPVVFVGTEYSPVKIVSYADRRQYLNQDGYAYVDLDNDRLVFTKQPASAKSVEFDYHAVPTDLTTSTSPVFPDRFHDVIYHGMCVDDFIIQQSDKAKSYARENDAKYNTYLDSMIMWNSRFAVL
jgi:hypothetical protein